MKDKQGHVRMMCVYVCVWSDIHLNCYISSFNQYLLLLLPVFPPPSLHLHLFTTPSNIDLFFSSCLRPSISLCPSSVFPPQNKKEWKIHSWYRPEIIGLSSSFIFPPLALSYSCRLSSSSLWRPVVLSSPSLFPSVFLTLSKPPLSSPLLPCIM